MKMMKIMIFYMQNSQLRAHIYQYWGSLAASLAAILCIPYSDFALFGGELRRQLGRLRGSPRRQSQEAFFAKDNFLNLFKKELPLNMLHGGPGGGLAGVALATFWGPKRGLLGAPLESPRLIMRSQSGSIITSKIMKNMYFYIQI